MVAIKPTRKMRRQSVGDQNINGMIVNSYSENQFLHDPLVAEDLTRITARGIKLSGPDFLLQAQQVMRKPLSVIQNLPSWIMDESFSDNDTSKEISADNLAPQLSLMALQAKRVQRIMEDMIEFDALRYHEKTPEKIDVRAKLAAMIDSKFPDGPGNFTILGQDLALYADAHLFDCLFSELLDNAVIHSEVPEFNVFVNIESLGAQIRISISDDGAGIPQKDHQRIFQPFEKLTDADNFETSGLGLAKVVRAAGLLGGAVDIGSSSQESGTAVLITLPTGQV